MRTAVLLAFTSLVLIPGLALGGHAVGGEANADASAAAHAGDALVTVVKGDLPIVLTAPHGGQAALPDTPARKDTGVRSFVILRDTNTAELTERLADAIERELGARPYVVVARFHRKYADANRPPADAYDHPKGKRQYDAFHAAVRDAVDDVRARWGGRGLLLDVHGQIARPTGIFRGTRDGTTVTQLLRRKDAGEAALVGENSVFGFLAAHGYETLPAVPAAGGIGREERFNGGHIVFAYGSHHPDGIDAIQMEFGTVLRRRARLDQTAGDVAKAVAAFARAHLPGGETGGDSPPRAARERSGQAE